MSTEMQTKVQASPAQNFTPVQTGLLQRKSALCNTPGLVEDSKQDKEKLTLQHSSVDQAGTATVPPIVHEVLRSPGKPLDSNTLSFMEPRFGHDFSRVRVHTDAKAAEAAHEVNARAFTIGKDVVFGAGEYAPENVGGKRLLAHEMTHVVQQNRGGTYAPAPLLSSNSEREADRAASTCMDGVGLILVAYGSAPGLARQPRSFSPSLNPTIESEITKPQFPSKSDDQLIATESKILLNYDDFSFQDGRPKSRDAQASIMFAWQKLEQVYTDANHGNERAKLFWQFLENDTSDAGINIAQQLYNHPCQIVPGMKCIINLERYDFLRKDKPGASRLRLVMYDAFEKRAHEIDLNTNLIWVVANIILTLAKVKGLLPKKRVFTLEASGGGKALAEEAKTLLPTKAPYPHSGATTSSKYSNLTDQQLRNRLVIDKEAAEALRLRYRKMTDRQLADRARRGDKMAESVRSQRTPPNEKLQKILGSDYRPPHEATAVVRDPQGKIMWSKKLTSGNMTPAEKALGFPQNVLAVHTEARAVVQAPLVRGRTLSISGQYNPCKPCQHKMAAAATKSGATIIYWWPGGRMVFTP